MLDTSHITVTPSQFQELQDLPIQGPFQMLNLLKFKKNVEGSSLSGAQAYVEYMQAVLPFIQTSNAKVIYQGKPALGLIGPEEKEWDKVLIVEYPDKNKFIEMMTAEGYPAELRSRALENSRLILCSS